jgi:hypothetical protein
MNLRLYGMPQKYKSRTSNLSDITDSEAAWNARQLQEWDV